MSDSIRLLADHNKDQEIHVARSVRSVRSFVSFAVLNGVAWAASAAQIDTVVVQGTRIGTSLDESASNGALGSKALLDTPFSVTVVNANEIGRRQVNSVAQLFINDASIFSASPAGTTAWWGAQIRGLPARSYYIDEVPLLLFYGGEFPLEPIERVVALKGLAGFMHGFGAPGGAIAYETKRPTNDRFTSTTLEYRNDGVVSAHLDTSGRAGDADGLGYRINVAGEFGEAYTTADIDRRLGSVAVDYPLSPNLQWFANALHEDSTLEHEPIYFYFDQYASEPLPKPTYDYEKVSVRNSYYKADTTVGSTGLRWRIDDDWRAKFAIGANRKEHLSNKMFAYLLNANGDYDGYAYNFAGLMENHYAQAIVQGEASWAGVRHELVFGTEYQRATTRWSAFYFSPDFTGNLYEPQPFRVTRDIDFGLAPTSEDLRQKAVFASDTLHFGDRWQALVGLRYTDFTSKDRDGDAEVESGYETHALSPTYALIFKPIAQMSIYASYVESMEPGRRVDAPYANIGERLDATVSVQYELGIKYEHARASFTAAAFRVERAAEIDELRDGARYLVQDGLTLYDGIEAMGSVNVLDGLALGLSAIYLDAKIDRVSDDNTQLKGKKPAGSSQWQAVASIDYSVAHIAGLSAYANVRYFGDAYYEDLNLVEIPHRTLVNVGIQYRTQLAGRRTVFMASINNLLNKQYWEINTLGEGRNAALGMQVLW